MTDNSNGSDRALQHLNFNHFACMNFFAKLVKVLVKFKREGMLTKEEETSKFIYFLIPMENKYSMPTLCWINLNYPTW